MKLTKTAEIVLKKRYLLRDDEGNVIETPEQMLWRVANAIAKAEELYGGNPSEMAKKFFKIMDEQLFLPNSPTLMNAGTELNQLSACFVIPIEDSIDGIFKALWDMAKVQKSGGGCINGDSLIFIEHEDGKREILKIRELFERVTAGKKLKEFGNGKYVEVDGLYTYAFDPINCEFKKAKITKVWIFDVPKFAKFKVRVGNIEIQTSDWHPFFVLAEDFRLVTKRGDELKVGDLVIRADLGDVLDRKNGKIISDDLAYVLGFILGDGSFGAVGKKSLNYIRDVISREFGTHVKINYENNIPYLVYQGKGITKFVEKALRVPFYKKGRETEARFIPEFVLDGALINPFLAGLFDAEGYVNEKPELEITMRSKDVVKDTSILLNLVGIKSSIREKIAADGWVEYRLQITELPNIIKFSNTVGRYLKSKKSEKLKEVTKRSYSTHGLKLSYDAFVNLLKPLIIREITNGSETKIVLKDGSVVSLSQWKVRGRISRFKLLNILRKAEELADNELREKLAKVRRLIELVEEVKEIVRIYSDEPFYDLSVEHYENYLAGTKNGFIVVHNTGFSFSRLRPKGDIVRSTKGVASGPVSFMKIFDCATEQIKQGGKRRGANMGVLSVHHPDVEEFIKVKWEEGVLRNFNISVAITDDFMEALKNDADIDLINPRTGKVVRKIPAKKIFDLIVEGAWRNGEPGMIFIDTINKYNPTPHVGKIEATNPCVTADTWIMTAEGPRQVKDLIGRKFVAVVNGRKYESDGFYFTGIKKVYRLKAKEGFELRLTGDHPVLKVKKMTRYVLETEWVKACDLKPGDKVVLNNHREFEGWGGKYSEKEGYLMGLLLGDGKEKAILSVYGDGRGVRSIREMAYQYARSFPHRKDFKGWIKRRNKYRTAYITKLARRLMPNGKAITPEIEKASKDFYIGFLRGLFDADGSVQGSQKKGISIRLSQSDLGILKAVQRMLLRLGIYSKIYKNRRKAGKRKLPDGRGGLKEYNIKAQHELVISNEDVFEFYRKIGFGDVEKAEKLEKLITSYKRKPNRTRFVATVESIDFEGYEEVYDAHVKEIHAFDANGFVVHNCGELPLLPYESCNLGSINVSKFVKGKDIDWDKLKEVVWLAVRFLDNVIDVNSYPIPEIEKMTKANRKIGLGVMGWADLLFKLRIPYDSEDALQLAERLMSFIQSESHKASQALAEERGVFPNWKGSVWEKKGIKMRNATTTSIAPTGTISIIAGCSSGIEPVYALAYKRTHILNGEEFFEINPVFEETLREMGLYSDELIAKIAEEGSIQGMKELPEEIRRVFKCALDIHWSWHVRMQAAFQKYVDNAVAKTVNLPNYATKEDVANVFLMAYELGCKGVTVYRDGSREEQVLVTKKTEKLRRFVEPRPRPKVTSGKTIRIRTGCGSLFVTINEDDYGLAEVFVHLGKSGSCFASQTEAIGRLISIALRSGVNPEAIIDQLKGIRCPSVGFDEGEMVTSCADGIAKALERYLRGDAKKVKPLTEFKEFKEEKSRRLGTPCPECGNILEYSEGCETCRVCGFTRCG